MNLASFSVRRPVLVMMVVLIVIVLGAISLSRLPIDLMPDISYPNLSISTTYENAAPEEVEKSVTSPIEDAMSAVPGVEEVDSVSTEGASNVRIMFSWGTDLDAAANDVRDRLDRVILPPNVKRPILRKFDPSSFPILILGVASNLDPIEVRKIIDDQITYRIERVPGVAAVDIRGGLEREVHVDLYTDKVKALGIPLDQIISRIQSGNLNLPAGTIERGNLDVTVRAPGEFSDLDQLRGTVVAIREGAQIRLGEIADVKDSWVKITRVVRVNGQPGTRLSVNKRSGANTVTVAEAVLKEVERINRDIPQIHIVPIMDTSDFIKRSISNVGSSALYGGIFAVIVLLFFLLSIRSTLVIATAIPISIIATFVLMYFGGFTLNILTLGALALGIGMLVDNAIVVLENIYRLRETGNSPEESAVKGTGEVTAAVVASTLTTLVVFLPLIFVRGMAGVMFTQVSLVISFSLFCSLAVALTLVPMLASKLLRRRMPTSSNPSQSQEKFGAKNRFFIQMENSYKELLHYALNHRVLVVIVAVILLGVSLTLIPFIGVELMPTSDEGQVTVSAEMEVGTRIDVLNEKFKTIENIVKESVPEAKNMVATIGGGGWHSSGSHTGEVNISLKPQSQRTRSSEQIAEDLRRKLANIPGAKIRTRAGGGLFMLRMAAAGGTEKVQVEVRGYDLETADTLAERVRQIVEEVDGVTDALVSRESGSPEELVITDRQKAADMKLSVSQIANMLQTVLSGTIASYYREGGDEYNILVKLKDAEKMDIRDILDLTLTNSDGQPVVLRNVVNVEPRSGPVRIERKDRERLVTVSANISGRDLGSILSDIRERLRSVAVPRGFSIAFGGEYEEQQKAFNELLLSLVLSLLLVYMVMACLYESLRDPFVVMFSVPLAVIGVTLALSLTNTTFNVQAFIGCIMLGGIVVNNAILLVDHTILLRRRDKMPLQEAIEEAGRRRLRPILMTALTTIMGLLPLALGIGEGGEAQAPMARVVIGGLTSSTLITLVFVPTVYSLFESRRASNT